MAKDIELDNVDAAPEADTSAPGYGKPQLQRNQYVAPDSASLTYNPITGSRTNNGATATVSYAHGLAKAPSRVAAHAACYTGGALSFSHGFWSGTSGNQNATYGSVGAAAVGNAGFIYIDLGGGVFAFGLISSVDATNVNIAWDKVGAPGGTTFFTLECFA